MGRPTRRTFSPQQKFEIVMQLLRGRSELFSSLGEAQVTIAGRRAPRLRRAPTALRESTRFPANRGQAPQSAGPTYSNATTPRFRGWP